MYEKTAPTFSFKILERQPVGYQKLHVTAHFKHVTCNIHVIMAIDFKH